MKMEKKTHGEKTRRKEKEAKKCYIVAPAQYKLTECN
jgi:hypothetical protein